MEREKQKHRPVYRSGRKLDKKNKKILETTEPTKQKGKANKPNNKDWD